jgi:hypothetical protein
VPTDNLARAIVAFATLVREAEARHQDRKRLRAASEEVALLLLEQLRVGDRAMVGPVVYEVEQVVWPEAVASTGQGESPAPHGARALLRDDRVLVVAERAERGRGRPRARSVGAALARRRAARPGQVAFDLGLAGDEHRLAFAPELGAVIEGFGLAVAAEAGELRRATTDLISIMSG